MPDNIGANTFSDPDARPETPASSTPSATPKRAGRPPGARNRRGAKRAEPLQRKLTPEDRAIAKAKRNQEATEKRAKARRAREDAKAARVALQAEQALTAPTDKTPGQIKNGGGAPTKYRKEYDDLARGMAILGCTNEDMAEALEINTRTLAMWKVRYPTFRIAINAGKTVADAQVANALFQRATGYKHKAVKVFLREKDEKPIYAPYTEHYAPDTNAMRLWLLNRRRDQWKDKQEVEVRDSIASMTPEQRMASVLDIMARARALLAKPEPADVADVSDAEYEETGKEKRGVR